ncbi:MAG: GGDEF domain-containing phosphodiesterase [Eubacteriales bacterium]
MLEGKRKEEDRQVESDISMMQLMAITVKPMLVLNNDAEYTVQYANDSFFKIFGTDCLGFRAKFQNCMRDTFVKEKREDYMKTIRSEIEQNERCLLDVQLNVADGENAWFYFECNQLKQLDGGEKLYCELNSIEKRISMIESINAERQYFQAVQKLTSDVLFRLNLKTHVVKHTGALAREFGLPSRMENFPEVLVNSNSIYEDDLEDYLAYVGKMFEGVAGTQTMRLYLPDGSYEWFHVECIILHDTKGVPIESIGKITKMENSNNTQEIEKAEKTETRQRDQIEYPMQKAFQIEAQAALRSKEEFNYELLGEVFAMFLKADTVYRTIESALALLGTATKAQGFNIFALDKETGLYKNLYRWYEEDVMVAREPIEPIPMDVFEILLGEIIEEGVAQILDISHIQNEMIQTKLRQRGVKAILQCYLKNDDDEIRYLLEVTEYNRDREWTPYECATVSHIAKIIFLFMNYKDQMGDTRKLNYDSLTGLITEHKFIEEAQKYISTDMSREYSIISVDLDNFKYINEFYGYDAGTKVLLEFSQYMQNFIHKPILLTRCFADNFLALVEHNSDLERVIYASMQNESVLIQQLKEALGDNYYFSFSMGIYFVENRNLNINYMINCANYARHIGKSEVGRTCYLFSDEMHKKRTAKNQIVAQMENALTQKEFKMYYQPKVDLRTNEIVGAEALVRWIQGDKIIPPNEFIPIFEKNGFIEKLDYYVVNEVCEFIKQNASERLPKISLNLSGFTVLKPNLVEKLVHITRAHGVKPTQLDLEITESALVDRFELAVKQIDVLKDLKFTISMDDFGTGISTLHRLREMSVDVLKIDKKFISDTLDNEKGIIILKNIIRMSKELEIETVAEGIETEEQLELLKVLGCDIGQGYCFSRPVPVQEFLDML